LLSPAELIERKRGGLPLTADEIEVFVLEYVEGLVPDAQMAAFLMAVVFRGLTPAETFALTDAMVRSGEVVDLAGVERTVVDKHSTGGVGDKVSIALGPIVAACGVPFGKMSGRGLGHTGGTLDKLESIPGYRVELTAEEFVRQISEVGLAIVGQTGGLVPADRKLYALRHATATVDEVSLIAASIMSKKIAAGAGAILLDVKVGEGAFMKTLDDARRLASTMLELGRRAGRRVACELTAMDQPLGHAVGNALEVREALAVLRGDGPTDLTTLVRRSAATLLTLSDLGIDESEAAARVDAAVRSGSAVTVYETWVRAQGGDPQEAALPSAAIVRPVPSPAAGYVQAISASGIGRVAHRLAAAGARAGKVVDAAAGVVCLAKHGDPVDLGQPVAEIHAGSSALAVAAAVDVAACYAVGPEQRSPTPLVLEIAG